MSWVHLKEPETLPVSGGSPSCAVPKTSVDTYIALWAHPVISSHICGTRGGSTHRARGAPGRSTQTAWGTWGARGTSKQHEKELVQRKGRAVKAAADDAQARGFKGHTFHFNSTPGAAVFPPDRPTPPDLTPEAPAQGFPAHSISSPVMEL